MEFVIGVIVLACVALASEYRFRKPDRLLIRETRKGFAERRSLLYPRHFTLLLPRATHTFQLTVEATAKGNLDVRSVHLAAFAGILSSHVRNADGLRNFLAELLTEITVTVIENVSRWVTIHERARLGRIGKPRHVLSLTSSLGQRVNDISGKFRIVLGPRNLEQYVSFLPGGNRTMIVNTLVRLYVRDALDYDVQLKLKTSEMPLLRLGDRALKIGLTTWLGRPRTESASRLVDYDDSFHSLIPSGAL